MQEMTQEIKATKIQFNQLAQEIMITRQKKQCGEKISVRHIHYLQKQVRQLQKNIQKQTKLDKTLLSREIELLREYKIFCHRIL